MKRDALRVFFQRVVLATLPLAGGCATEVAGGPDLANAPIVIDGGFPDGGSCADYCPTGQRCTITPTDMGTTVISCFTDHTGRRPATLRAAAPARASSELGALFAEMAHLEEASIAAFRTLADELRTHGAPRALIAAAREAARDEVRHAALTARLARRYGGVPVAATVDPARPRSLAELAVENAIEGCVRESYGALVATWQARVARDPRVQRAMAAIAADETRHAELAWRVAGWAQPRLDDAARARVDAARAQALAELQAEADAEPPAALIADAGVPSRAQARALSTAFAREVAVRARG